MTPPADTRRRRKFYSPPCNQSVAAAAAAKPEEASGVEVCAAAIMRQPAETPSAAPCPDAAVEGKPVFLLVRGVT